MNSVKGFESETRGHSLTIGIILLLMLSPIGNCFVLGEQLKEPQQPPVDAVMIQLQKGERNTIQYNYIPGKPLAISGEQTNVVMTANNQVQLQYSADNQLAIKYLGVDITSEKPLKLQIQGDMDPEQGKAPSDGLGEYYLFKSEQGTTARITLRLYVDVKDYAESLGRPVSHERLSWAYYNGEEWSPVQSHVDEQNNIVAEGECGQYTIRELREGELPKVAPGVSTQERSQVKALNYTEVDPLGFKYSLGEAESTMFMFQNTAMVFGSTQPLKLNLSSENTIKNKLGVELETEDETELTVSMCSSPMSDAEEARGVGVYINMELSSTGTMKARLAMQIHAEALKAKYGNDFEPNMLRWAYWNGEMWMEVPSTITEDVIEAETNHLSTWTVMESKGLENTIVKVNVGNGTQSTVNYSYSPGTSLVISGENTNVVMTANNQVQLQYSAENQLAIKYLGVEVESEKPLTLQVHGDYHPDEAPGVSDSLGEYYLFQANEQAQLKLKLFVDAQDYAVKLGRPVDQARLTWAYYNGEEWSHVQSHMDEDGNLVAEGECGQYTIREMREGELPEIVPGVSTKLKTQVRALNYTELDPLGFKYSLGEGESAMFMFQNTAMVFNSTKMLNLNLSAENTVQNKVLGVRMQTNAATMLNVSMTATPSSGATAVKGIGVYMSLEHNATGLLKAQLAMPIDMEALKKMYGSTFDPQRLRWAYWSGEKWMEVPSTLTNSILTAETDHFSTWTIMETQEALNPAVTPEVTSTLDYTWYYLGGGLTVVVVVAVFLLRGRK